MKNLDLQFRPVADFLLDFIHKSPCFALNYVGDMDNFKVYTYENKFVLTRLLYTLYRVDFVDVDIFVNSSSSYTKLRLLFDVHTTFPSIRFECTICDCGEFLFKCYYIDNDDNDE